LLIIREDQMKVLSEDAGRRYESRVLDHLRRCFPAQAENLGEEHLRHTIRSGVGKAGAYGIECEREVSMYIDLMVLFGEDFDTDAAYPGARSILQNQALDQQTKMQRLYALFGDLGQGRAKRD